jgi:hypothetical protein
MTKRSNNRFMRVINLSVLIICLGIANFTLAKDKSGATKADTADSTNPAKPADPNSPKATPASSTQPTATAGSSGPIESQVLAYSALADRAVEVGKFLQTFSSKDNGAQAPASAGQSPASGASTSPVSKKTNFVVLDATQLALVPAYRAFMIQSLSLRSQFCHLLSVPQTGAELQGFPPTATQFSAAITAATAFLTMIKQTVTVTPASLTLPDEAFVAAVRDTLPVSVSLYYPTLFPVGLGETPSQVKVPDTVSDACDSDASQDTLLARATTLQYLRGLSGLTVSKLDSESDVKKKASQQSLHDVLTLTNTAFDSMMTSLSASDPTTGRSAWDGLLRGEKLAGTLAGTASSSTFVVELKVQSAGGETITRDSLFFIGGTKYSYSGGVILTAMVFNASSGALVGAKNFWKMSGDRDRKSFNSVANP